MNKPPLGIVPRQIWEEQRKEDIRLALLRKLENNGSNWDIPIEWVEEYNSLAKESKKKRDWDFELLKEIKEKQLKANDIKKFGEGYPNLYKKVGWIEGRQMMPVTAINGVYNQIF